MERISKSVPITEHQKEYIADYKFAAETLNHWCHHKYYDERITVTSSPKTLSSVQGRTSLPSTPCTPLNAWQECKIFCHLPTHTAQKELVLENATPTWK
jgi:hypothetical protein